MLELRKKGALVKIYIKNGFDQFLSILGKMSANNLLDLDQGRNLEVIEGKSILVPLVVLLQVEADQETKRRIIKKRDHLLKVVLDLQNRNILKIYK